MIALAIPTTTSIHTKFITRFSQFILLTSKLREGLAVFNTVGSYNKNSRRTLAKANLLREGITPIKRN